MGIIMEIMEVLPATTGYLWGISLGYLARDFQAKRDPAEIFYRPKTIVWWFSDQNGGVLKWGWFIMENPTLKWLMNRVTPMTSETSKCELDDVALSQNVLTRKDVVSALQGSSKRRWGSSVFFRGHNLDNRINHKVGPPFDS